MTDYRDEAVAPQTSIEEFRKIVEQERRGNALRELTPILSAD